MSSKVNKIRKTIKLLENTVKGILRFPVAFEESTSFSYRISEMLTLLMRLRRFTDKELQGYFTLSELCFIYDAIKNLHYTGEIGAKQFLKWQIDDVVLEERLDWKYRIDAVMLIEKVDKLSEFQAYVVISNMYEARNWHADDKDIATIIAMIFSYEENEDDEEEEEVGYDDEIVNTVIDLSGLFDEIPKKESPLN